MTLLTTPEWLPNAEQLLWRLAAISLELTLLAAAMALLMILVRPPAGRWRAALWALVLAKPLLGLLVGSPATVVRIPAPSGLELRSAAPGDLTPLPAMPSASGLTAPDAVPVDLEPPSIPARDSWARLLLMIWLAGLGGAALAAAGEAVRLFRLTRRSVPPDPSLQERYRGLARRLGIRRPPPLRLSVRLDSPALVGSLKPRVILPVWLTSRLSHRQLEWALSHELVHFRRRDHLVNLLRRVSQAVFFFHPAAWWAGRRWRREAEAACDRAVVHDTRTACGYARLLCDLAAALKVRRQLKPAGGLYAGPSEARRRIETLLQHDFRPSPLSARVGVAVLLALGLAGLAAGARFEREAYPEFEGVSEGFFVRGDVEEIQDGWRLGFQIRGYFQFRDDHRRIVSVGPAARLKLVEEAVAGSLEVRVARGPDGLPEFDFQVDGRPRPWNAAAQRWLGERLYELLGEAGPPPPAPRVLPRPALTGDVLAVH